MTHPYSLFIWQPGQNVAIPGHWIEPAQVYTEQYALYLANLIYQDTYAIIKVVRYGRAIACFPDEQAVKMAEQQIAKQDPPRWLSR